MKPRTLTREEFDRRYWKVSPDTPAGAAGVPASTRREFYSDYRESGLSFPAYVRSTSSGWRNNPRSEYLDLVERAARDVVRERQRSQGSSYHGDNERGLETALRMASSAGVGAEARSIVRKVLRGAPAVRVSPGIAFARSRARAARRAQGGRAAHARDRIFVHNPAGSVVFTKEATYNGRKRFEARTASGSWSGPKVRIEQVHGISKHGATKGQRTGPADWWTAEAVRGIGKHVLLGTGTKADMKATAKRYLESQ